MNTANILSSDEKRSDVKKNMPQIGCGSSRSVYQLEGGLVVKYAFEHNKVGIAQNKEEYNIYRKAKNKLNILCPIIDVSKKRDVLVMQQAIPFNSQDVPLKLQNKFFNFRKKINFLKALWSIKEQSIMNSKRDIKRYIRRRYTLTKEEGTIMNSNFFSQVCELILTYGLLIGDLIRYDSWGYINNRFVLIDYGCTVKVYNKYY